MIIGGHPQNGNDAVRAGVRARANDDEPSEAYCDDGADVREAPVHRRHGWEGLPSAENRTLNPFTGVPYSEHYYRLLATRRMLPMSENRDLIVSTVAAHKVTLLVGETGSGKSTQLPQFLIEALGGASGRLVCTQPRRVAALSLAQRVSEEMDVRLGDEVGYSVRFEERRSDKTRVSYVTDGMLLREVMRDPMLTQYKIVMIDEAHERTVSSDLLLGLIKLNLLKRDDIHVVIMSATLDVEKFQANFKEAPTVRVPGRMFPVQHFYTDNPVKDYVASAIEHAWRVHTQEGPGDVLAFLIGEAEIEMACRKLQHRIDDAIAEGQQVKPVSIRALYGAQSIDEQRKVFVPPTAGERRIIFATNIAETSLTIDGVVYVIDSGYCKQHTYIPDSRLDCLASTVISKAAAMQRAGRAGRTQPGKCFRLFCERDWALLPAQTYPEMQRSNLTDICLTMLRLGVTNLVEFPYLDAPAPATLADALTQLLYLEVVDDDFNITELGKQVAEYPVDVCTARMLLLSPKFGCSAEIAVIAAMLSNTSNVFMRPVHSRTTAEEARQRFTHAHGDHLTLFTVFMAYQHYHKSPAFCKDMFLSFRALQQADRIYYQLLNMMTRRGLPVVSCLPPGPDGWKHLDSVRIRQAVVAGFFTKVAFMPTNYDAYVQMKERMVSGLHPSSVLAKAHGPKPRWVVFNEFELTSAEAGPLMKTVSVIDVEWLPTISSAYFNPSEIDNSEASRILQEVTDRQQRQQQQQGDAVL
jgi:pre-mRNA-splicing factor ATP-dependent RNA helicase DHX15/PRP43